MKNNRFLSLVIASIAAICTLSLSFAEEASRNGVTVDYTEEWDARGNWRIQFWATNENPDDKKVTFTWWIRYTDGDGNELRTDRLRMYNWQVGRGDSTVGPYFVRPPRGAESIREVVINNLQVR